MKQILWTLLVGLPLALVVWALAAKEQGNMGWGNVVHARDQGAADLFGLPGPGAYVGTKRGTALPAVRGGLKLILSFEDPGLGMRALRSHVFTGLAGWAVFVGALVWILDVVLLMKARARSAPGAPTP